MRPLIALFLCALPLVSCKSEEELARERPPSTPLAFDPTEKHQLSRWWTNGSQLVRLDEVHSYAIFADTNRYREPVEVGRWRQQNYAVLWFEPYDRVERQPLRVEINKIDGRLALNIPGNGSRPPVEGLMGQAEPPLVIEDRLLGEWSGSGGWLRLESNGRYRFSPTTATSTSAAAGERPAASVHLAGYDGQWLVDGDQLVLRPDVPGMPATAMKLSVRAGDEVVLTGAGGELKQPTAVVGAEGS